jgi:phosphonoacetaldehyde hydrolase
MFTYPRRYRGPLQAVILDWAGTTVDFGCLAPAAVFQRIFEEAGVPVSIAEARAVMGLHKRDHIAAMLAEPDIARRWQQVHGSEPGAAEVDRLFDRFFRSSWLPWRITWTSSPARWTRWRPRAPAASRSVPPAATRAR